MLFDLVGLVDVSVICGKTTGILFEKISGKMVAIFTCDVINEGQNVSFCILKSIAFVAATHINYS